MTRQLPAPARARHALLALALGCATLAAVTAAPGGANAAGSDQLVVVDVTSADSPDFSAGSLKTVSTDGSTSFAKPVDLPTADGTGVNAFALGGDSNGNGSLARSADGNHLAIGGYHHVPGATGQVKTTGAVKPKDTKTADSADGPGVQRMVGRVDNTGAVDTSTLLGTSLNTAHPRGVATDTGSSFYVSGNGGATDTGVFSVALGGGARTAIAGGVSGSADQRNTRNIQIADGGLFTVSEKVSLAGLGRVGASGLPTTKSAITRLGSTISTADLPVPTALVMLDANASVTGVDTAYISVDTDDNGVNDEVRKYTSDGTTWTQNGAKTGDYPFLTGRVSGGAVQLYASKGSTSGNTVVGFSDAGGSNAADFGSESTIATAPAGHAYRGLAFAPTGWDPGTISSSAPTASVAHAKVGNTIGDTNNPGTTLTLADDDTDAADLTVEAHSSDTDVIPDAGIEVTGSGLERSVSFTPAGKGRAAITFIVTDDNDNTGTAQVSYAASSSPESSSGRYLYESSDLSSAVDVGDGHILAASSEDNSIRLYQQGQSGRPVTTFDFGDADGIGSTNADIESMTRVNDTLYVLGSHGNNSSGDAKPARRVLFTAAVGGSGADTTLTFIGAYTGLWDALRTWDQANGDRLGFAAGQAPGVPASDANGFNIEGIEFAPGSTSTAYLAFRAPLVMHDGKPHAVIVPVENANALVLGSADPQFGDPIHLDLGGRTIREIRDNGDDEFLISAQSDSGSPQWQLFAWDGDPATQPVAVKDLPDPEGTRTGSWETIVSVPSPLTDGGSVTLIADSGDTTYYGDATAGADESKGFRKSYVDEFTTSAYTPPVFSAPSDLHSTATTSSSVTLEWTKVPDATGYVITKGVGDAGTRSSQTVGDVSSATISGLTAGTGYTFDIAAVKAGGTESEASPRITVTTSAAPADRPSNLQWTSRTATAMTLTWDKKSGSAKYKISYLPTAAGGTRKYLTVGNVSTASVSGLLRGKEYSFKVAGISSNGTQSPYSSVLTARTSSLRAPTNLSMKSRTSTTITLTWTKATGANGYRIYSGVGSAGTRTKVEVSGGDTQTVKLTGLRPGKYYTIDIASLEGTGNSRSSYSPRIGVRTSG
ncbi:MAG: fibronectin type III domain-containing protein [Aeromicrobium sp.]